MKKLLTLLSVTALSFVFINSSQAQLFQNSNSSCEEMSVLFGTIQANSVACRNINGDADFNGDGYPDCGILTDDTDLGDPEVLSVFMNRAASATNCSSGTGDQFEAAADYGVSGLTGTTVANLASLVAGPLESTSAFDNLAAPNLTGNDVFAVANSVAAGGFGAPGLIDTTATNVLWDQSTADNGFFNSSTEKNAALLDCDNDGDLDAAMAIGNGSSDFFGVNIMLNNGSSLQDANIQALTSLVYSSGDAAMAVGDFNNDGFTDVVLTMVEGGSSFLEVCTNDADGTCGFTCLDADREDLDVVLGASPVSPTSVVAGDFDGDGNVDAAFTTPSLPTTADRGLAFAFGDGSGAFASIRNAPFADAPSRASPRVAAVGCFDNDNNPDVAYTYGNGQLTAPTSIAVYTGITSATQTTTVLTFDDTALDPWGIDTADFDQQGGDDIMAVATSSTITANPRQAFVFMNSVETIVANAGADVSTEATSVQLTGTCATDPADASAVFAPTWTIVSPASGGTLTNANTLTPTLTTTTTDTFVVRLTCRTRCDDTATDTVSVTTGGLCLEGSGIPGKSSTNCAASCSFNPFIPFSWGAILAFISGLGALWILRRRK